MSLRHHLHRLSIDDVELILTVTSKLAAPFDLTTILAEVGGDPVACDGRRWVPAFAGTTEIH